MTEKEQTEEKKCYYHYDYKQQNLEVVGFHNIKIAKKIQDYVQQCLNKNKTNKNLLVTARIVDNTKDPILEFSPLI